MMMLGAAKEGSPEARAYILDRLAALAETLKSRTGDDALTTAFYRQSARDIARYLSDPAANAPASASPDWGTGPRSRFPLPPGPPLGG
jgi:hypothetical protein